MGDLVEIKGVTQGGGFAPYVRSSDVSRIGPGGLPKPSPADLEKLFTGREDSRWVQAEGTVSAIWADQRATHLTLVEGIRSFEAEVPDPITSRSDLLNAKVRIEGACGTNINVRRQPVGFRIFAPGWEHIQVLERDATKFSADLGSHR